LSSWESAHFFKKIFRAIELNPHLDQVALDDSLYQGQYFVKVKGSERPVVKFIKRILEAKTNAVVQGEMPF
jgi:hypothetical protein